MVFPEFMQDLVPLILALLVGFAIWSLLSFFSSKTSDAQANRLKKLSNRAQENVAETTVKKGKLDILLQTAKALASPMMPSSEGEQTEIRKELSAAGFRSENAVPVFQGIRFITLLAFLIPSVAYYIPMYGMNFDGLKYVVIFSALGMYIPKIGLWYIRTTRQEEIFLTLPDIIDLLVVCVESGLGLDAALRKVCDEMKDHAKVMASELKLANFQLQIGRTRKDVLRDLGERNGVDDLRGLTTIIIQADRFGSSIANALRVQSDTMRTKRRQLAEEKASKCAVQLLFPMLFFIFPGVFIILVGPAAIKMMMSGAF